MRRTRRQPEPGEFQNQLSNYDPPEHADEMERSLCEDTVGVIESTPFLRVPPEMTIVDVVQQMADLSTACAVVVDENEHPVGIFSEQDALVRLAEGFNNIKHKPVSELMTEDPVVVYETDSPARVLNMMSTGGFRHVPIVDADGKIKGLIGTRRLTAYLEQFFPTTGAAS